METMSWFDTSEFANLAKNVLKEAQKTIDKALDIKEDEADAPQSSLTSPEGEVTVCKEKVPRSESEPELSTSASSSAKLSHSQSASLWGSFTGSFFDNPRANTTQYADISKSESPSRPTNFISNQPKKSAQFRSEDEVAGEEERELEGEPPDPHGPSDIRDEILNYPPVVYRKKEPRNYNNRLSAISSEGDRRSSSSVEVLGSCTPDSEPPPSLSSSSSVVRLRQSGSFESVEVLTSPSSVEVLGSSSSEREHKYSSDSISPIAEGEGVPELVEDSEPSVAEDSYTSASETLTSGTVLDLQHSRDLMLSSLHSMDTSFTDHSKDVSGEDETLTDGSGGESSLQRVSSASYLKHLLADAMTEQSPHTSPPPTHREHSPISSERSDMIKVGSSGHTSGDELETTTSSDIEIISSPTPNGDSSSAASRQSPARSCTRAKMALAVNEPHSLGKVFISRSKGHQRELSEASSGGSDDGSEIDKLLKKISEMTEILEVREAKLIDLSRLNCDLQESNSDLKKQLESRQQRQDVSELNEEFTQRLAALERKFQQAIRDKEQLRKQLEQAKVTAAVAEEEADKDQVITDLRAEGEKLSKQQLTLNNIIKKLRATEKENQKLISSLKEQVEEYSGEVERSKKALTAKQDVERSQIEAVYQLTKTNTKLESQVVSLQTQVDGLTSTIVSLQKEVSEKSEQCSQLQARLAAVKSQAESEVRDRLEAEYSELAEQRDQLENTVTQLREKLDLQSDQHDKQLRAVRDENANLLRRLEAAGSAVEEVAQSVSAATQPLVRQIDSLTSSHLQAQATWERQERTLHQQISELETRISALADSERSAKEQLVAGNSRVTTLDTRLATTQRDLDTALIRGKELSDQVSQLAAEKLRLEQDYKESERKTRAELAESEREVRSLQHQLSVERAALDAERRKTSAVQEQLKSATEGDGRGPSPPTTPRSSPTLSLGRLSLADSMASNLWPSFGDDAFETASTSGRMSSVYDSLRPGNTTSLLEALQSQLKQRDGEVHQLQWELSRREVERAALSNELATLTVRVEMQEKQLAALNSLQTEYDALLLLYGEKLEESQELRMDLQDVKDMYKTQIDQLLKKEPNTSS